MRMQLIVFDFTSQVRHVAAQVAVPLLDLLIDQQIKREIVFKQEKQQTNDGNSVFCGISEIEIYYSALLPEHLNATLGKGDSNFNFATPASNSLQRKRAFFKSILLIRCLNFFSANTEQKENSNGNKSFLTMKVANKTAQLVLKKDNQNFDKAIIILSDVDESLHPLDVKLGNEAFRVNLRRAFSTLYSTEQSFVTCSNEWFVSEKGCARAQFSFALVAVAREDIKEAAFFLEQMTNVVALLEEKEEVENSNSPHYNLLNELRTKMKMTREDFEKGVSILTNGEHNKAETLVECLLDLPQLQQGNGNHRNSFEKQFLRDVLALKNVNLLSNYSSFKDFKLLKKQEEPDEVQLFLNAFASEQNQKSHIDVSKMKRECEFSDFDGRGILKNITLLRVLARILPDQGRAHFTNNMENIIAKFKQFLTEKYGKKQDNTSNEFFIDRCFEMMKEETDDNEEGGKQNDAFFDYYLFFHEFSLFLNKISQFEMQFQSELKAKAELERQRELQQKILVSLNVQEGIAFNKLLTSGVSPNSFVKCEALDFETQFVLRDSNPIFNHIFENTFTKATLLNEKLIEQRKLRLEVYHKAYNKDFKVGMYRNELVGVAYLKLPANMKPCCKEVAMVRVNPINNNQNDLETLYQQSNSEGEAQLMVEFSIKYVQNDSNQVQIMQQEEQQQKQLKSQEQNNNINNEQKGNFEFFSRQFPISPVKQSEDEDNIAHYNANSIEKQIKLFNQQYNQQRDSNENTSKQKEHQQKEGKDSDWDLDDDEIIANFHRTMNELANNQQGNGNFEDGIKNQFDDDCKFDLKSNNEKQNQPEENMPQYKQVQYDLNSNQKNQNLQSNELAKNKENEEPQKKLEFQKQTKPQFQEALKYIDDIQNSMMENFLKNNNKSKVRFENYKDEEQEGDANNHFKMQQQPQLQQQIFQKQQQQYQLFPQKQPEDQIDYQGKSQNPKKVQHSLTPRVEGVYASPFKAVRKGADTNNNDVFYTSSSGKKNKSLNPFENNLERIATPEKEKHDLLRFGSSQKIKNKHKIVELDNEYERETKQHNLIENNKKSITSEHKPFSDGEKEEQYYGNNNNKNDFIQQQKKNYQQYLNMHSSPNENNSLDLDLNSERRSVQEQQEEDNQNYYVEELRLKQKQNQTLQQQHKQQQKYQQPQQYNKKPLLKSDQELDRIANIMKQGFNTEYNKFFDCSSDSD